MLQSKRLTYRRLSEEEYKIFHDLYTNPVVMRYAYLDLLKSGEKTEAAFRETLKLQREGEGDQFVATLKDTGADIAIVDYEVLIKREQGGICEVGYFILPEYWGCGYGAEMGRAMIDELFANHPIHKIVASCNGNNQSSENIMIKLGMQKEGILRKVRYKDGRWDDEIKYGLLREEWEEWNNTPKFVAEYSTN